jgi:hypothetical protein
MDEKGSLLFGQSALGDTANRDRVWPECRFFFGRADRDANLFVSLLRALWEAPFGE